MFDLDSRETLNGSERWWVSRADLLSECGYTLRPRFRPGWTPSWKLVRDKNRLFEDALTLQTQEVMDATRVRDGRVVVIKRIITAYHEHEIPICKMLNTPERRSDPRNHAVEILDHFTRESSQFEEFIVMPVLVPFDFPPFVHVDEVIDFVNQVLEGIVYLHEQNIAHRDCAFTNIMMDPGSLFLPPGFHPMWYTLNPDATSIAKYRHRNSLQGSERVRYVFIDFGISAWFNKDMGGKSRNGFYYKGEPAAFDVHGADRDVPELDHPHKAHDPFKVDVFMLGNVFKKKLLAKYANLGFLDELAAKMTDGTAKARPTAAEAKAEFERVLKGLSDPESRQLLQERNAPSKAKDLKDLLHDAAYQLRKKLHMGK